MFLCGCFVLFNVATMFRFFSYTIVSEGEQLVPYLYLLTLCVLEI